MQLLKAVWFFYQKMIIPSFAVSILLSLFTMSYIQILPGIGIAFIFLTPAFHYYIYELRNPDEYYFYYNMGLGKITLWISTIILSIIVGVILIVI
ncbi:MAG: hypothetical protein V4687_05695 [Bacteroidota bacterium]